MSDKKKPYIALIIAGAFLQVQLDEDIYTEQVQTATGLDDTVPAPPILTIPVSAKYAVASGLVQRIVVKVEKGTGATLKKRSIGILCEVAKLDTVRAELAGKIIKLGNGTGVDWTIQ